MGDYYTTWQGCTALLHLFHKQESDLKWNGGDFGQNNYPLAEASSLTHFPIDLFCKTLSSLFTITAFPESMNEIRQTIKKLAKNLIE